MTRFRAALLAAALLAVVAVVVALARPKPGNAWTPAAGRFADDAAAWQTVHAGFAARSKQGGVEVVFLGDSYTHGWPADLWDAHFAPLGAVRYGIRGDGTAQLLWRVGHGELDGVRPRVVVLMVGLNNALLVGDSAGDAVRGVAAILAAIRVGQPGAKVLLLGVLPAFDAGHPVRAWAAEFNARAANLADGTAVRFLDPGADFLTAAGDRKPGLYASDRVHLAPPGYALLAERLGPALADALK